MHSVMLTGMAGISADSKIPQVSILFNDVHVLLFCSLVSQKKKKLIINYEFLITIAFIKKMKTKQFFRKNRCISLCT